MNSKQPDIYRQVSDAIEDFQDGNLDAAQLEQLRALLKENPDARKAFLEHNSLSQLIATNQLLNASEQHAPKALAVNSSAAANTGSSSKTNRWFVWATAASLLIGLGMAAYLWTGETTISNNVAKDLADQVAFRPESPDMPVAVLLNAKDAKWSGQSSVGVSGVPLRKGWLNLDSGTASIRFDSGAVATLIGPSRFQILSSSQGFLAFGNLVANVPKQARGFRVDTKAMQLTDLGTEFGVRVGDKDETEVHVIHGLVEVECETSENGLETFELKENEARKFANKNIPNPLPLDDGFVEKVVASRPTQRIGYYTFRSIENEDGSWTTDPSARSVGGDGAAFGDFIHLGVEPGPIEYTENLNRWSFKAWRKNFRNEDFYIGFKVSAEAGKLVQLNQLSLELFRAGGNEKADLAPKDGVVRVSSDGFKTFHRFILLDNDNFVREAKFVSAELAKIAPASEFEFRFLFKGQSRARAIRLDEVTLDLDVMDSH